MKLIKTLIITVLLAPVMAGCATSPERGDQGKHLQGNAAYSLTDMKSAVRDLPVLGEESSLDDYLKYAALNNPGLEAAFNRWKASVERIAQARSLPDPQLSYGYFIQEVETRVGPQQQKIELSQMFPWFGKLRLKEDIATHAAEAEFSMYEAKKLKLFYNVKDFYFEYYFLAQAIKITKENMKLMEDLEEVARRKYSAGSADHAVVIKAQVELGRLDDRLRTLNDFRKPIIAKLNATLNRKSTAPLPWPKSMNTEHGTLAEADVLKWLQAGNPELKALDAAVKQQENAIDLAKKSYFPDIMLGAGWIDTGDALNPEMAGSGDDPIIGMIGLNIPIWFGKYRAAEKEAASRHTAALRDREDRENTLSADISLSFFKYQDAIRKIDLYGKSLIPKAKQSLEVSKQAFESGKLDFLTLIDAERVLLEFELAHERALADREQRLAEMEMLTGKQISTQEE